MLKAKFIIPLAFIGLCSFGCASSSRVVVARPAPVIIARPMPPHPGWVYVSESWSWSPHYHRYVHRPGHWVAPRRGYVYVEGNWHNSHRGRYWERGHWRRAY